MRTDPDRSLNEDEAEKGEVEGSMVAESEKDQVFTILPLSLTICTITIYVSFIFS